MSFSRLFGVWSRIMSIRDFSSRHFTLIAILCVGGLAAFYSVIGLLHFPLLKPMLPTPGTPYYTPALAGVVALLFFGLALVYRQGIQWPIYIFSLILVCGIAPGLPPATWHETVPQGVWIPVLVAFALTGLRWMLFLTAIELASIVYFQAHNGAFQTLGPSVTSAIILIMLITIRRNLDRTLAAEKAEREKAEQARRALDELNRTLESMVRERTAELEHAMVKLNDAQETLKQADRLANLGGMVATVMHEVNTPIGSAVLCAGQLADSSVAMRSAVAAQQVRRSELNDYLQKMEAGADLIMKNLDRAERLMVSFKEMSVDQTSGLCREFELGAYVDTLLATLAPQYQRRPIKVLREQPSARVNLLASPGALAQVMTNLVMNSLTHAFAPDQQGEIRISHRLEGEQVVLKLCDNGCGISAEDLPHIFDPFFTTRRGQGGSGLGLSIAKSLVEGTLGGEIVVTSAAGEGACFVLRLPLVAPTSLKS